MSFFNLHGCLPEKQVWWNGGAKNANQRHKIGFIGCNCWQHGILQYLGPVDIDKKGYQDVAEKGEAEPFQDKGYFVVWPENDTVENQQREQEREKKTRYSRKEKIANSSHPGNVGTDIEGNGGETDEKNGIEEIFWIIALYGAGKAVVGNQSDTCTHLLDGDHQRIGYKGAPK